MSDFPMGKKVCLLFLLAVLAVAVPANYMWIVDYRARLESGIKFLKAQLQVPFRDGQALEQARWSNAKILGIIVMILGILTQYPKLGEIPVNHRVPVLTIVLLVIIALFDAALDLEAEWTISILGATRRIVRGRAQSATLPEAIWNTNQFKKRQALLYEHVRSAQEARIGFGCFSATAQNLVSFAALIVFCVVFGLISLLWGQLVQ